MVHCKLQKQIYIGCWRRKSTRTPAANCFSVLTKTRTHKIQTCSLHRRGLHYILKLQYTRLLVNPGTMDNYSQLYNFIVLFRLLRIAFVLNLYNISQEGWENNTFYCRRTMNKENMRNESSVECYMKILYHYL